MIGDLDGSCERLIERTQKNRESVRSEFEFGHKIDDDEDTRVPLSDYTIIELSIYNQEFPLQFIEDITALTV